MQKLSDKELLAEIEVARQSLSTRAQSPPFDSILRQLDWGRRKLLGEEVEPKPGPFTMGLIAVRELDGFPEVADHIFLIESELVARESLVVLSNDEKRRRKQAYKKHRT